MTKQLITLLGALLSVAVLAAAVMIGIVPLIGGVLGAYAQRQTVASTNSTYEMQIAALEQQQERIDEIQDAVGGLRAQIPQAERLNEVFERIARAEEAAGVRVVSVSRGDLVPYAVRTGTGDDAAAVPAPASSAPDAGGAAADPNAPADASQDAPATAGQPAAAAPAADPATASRQQVELSISISAPDIASAVAFLDGLRTGPRAIAIDTAVVTGSPGSFDVQITAVAFIQRDGDTEGGE